MTREQFIFKDQKINQLVKSAFKIIGLISIFFGFLILYSIYFSPMTTILGEETTLAQVHSSCGNTLFKVINVGSCGDDDPFYFRWAMSALLIIIGLIEVLISYGIFMKNLFLEEI